MSDQQTQAMKSFLLVLLLGVGLSKVQAQAEVSYTFPKTKTSQFVHGLCVMGASSAHAEASDASVKYSTYPKPWGNGVKVWRNRNYKTTKVSGAAMCEGGIYLQPTLHKSIRVGTEVTMEAVPKGDEPVTFCAFVEYGHGRRHGQWESVLPKLGFKVSNPFQWNQNHERMKSYCKVVANPTPSPTKTPTPVPTPNPTPKPSGSDIGNRSGTDPEKRTPTLGSSSGDPHFRTWTGDKYDYHGECDLVLVDNPSFANGLGMRLHIRTTRVKYFSFIEKVALQIGDETLEFSNDVENFLINGEPIPQKKKHQETKLGGFVVRRDPKAISVRLQDGTGPHQKQGAAKIDFHMRMNGFPAVIVDAGHTDIFQGSLGLLGEWDTGRKLARDGKTEFTGIDRPEDDATAFALEWQVRDDEPMLFKDARFPQYPSTCLPPAKMVDRIGSSQMKMEAEEACAHWKDDKEDCIFDVMATRDILVAEEGYIVHVQ